MVQSWSRIGGVRGIDPCADLPHSPWAFGTSHTRAAYDETSTALSPSPISASIPRSHFGASFAIPTPGINTLSPSFPLPRLPPPVAHTLRLLCASFECPLVQPLVRPIQRPHDHTQPRWRARLRDPRRARLSSNSHSPGPRASWPVHSAICATSSSPSSYVHPRRQLDHCTLTVNCTGTGSILLHQLLVRLVGQLARIPGHDDSPNHAQCCPHRRDSSTPAYNPQ